MIPLQAALSCTVRGQTMKCKGDPDSEVGFRIIQLPLVQISQYPKMAYVGSIILSPAYQVVQVVEAAVYLPFPMYFEHMGKNLGTEISSGQQGETAPPPCHYTVLAEH
jgi:hypothetical protein